MIQTMLFYFIDNVNNFSYNIKRLIIKRLTKAATVSGV